MPEDLLDTAISRLVSLIDDARSRGAPDPMVAALATATLDGAPSVRTITICRIDRSGLAFFAHADSGKGKQLRGNPRAALCFHWPMLRYQVILEGAVSMLSGERSEALWRIVPRDVGLGHWASDQTRPADADLNENVRTHRQRFSDERVPLAPGWHAFEIAPARIDFWPSGWHRLQPRERFSRSADGAWVTTMQNP